MLPFAISLRVKYGANCSKLSISITHSSLLLFDPSELYFLILYLGGICKASEI
uniref:Candidate secreted effector n=1 Tax=Meloidogyne incognita TaxID=6306 RepID=A0A914N1X7_MELIC